MEGSDMDLYLGDEVTWQAKGSDYVRTRRGKVVAIIPAGHPAVIPEGYKMAPGSFGGGNSRDHESYVVAVDVDAFWPKVSDIKKVNKTLELANALSKFVNGMDNKVEDVVDILAGEHRTLQQGITRFCVAWLAECDKMQKAGHYDLRNQASVELGMKFMARMTPQERAMPII